jgi:glycyl-tRNA synthetase
MLLTELVTDFKKIISYAKSYGFIFPSSEIYKGLTSIYDYGYYGVLLKNNIKEYWWKAMTQLHSNIIGIETSLLTHSKTWLASGHIQNFNEFVIYNKDSNLRYRVDDLIQNYINNIFLDSQEIKNIIYRMNMYIHQANCKKLRDLIIDLEIKEPETNSFNWGCVKKLNLMFSTSFCTIDSHNHNKEIVYLRPETAQGVFINFINLVKTYRCKVPFGVAQIGKSFRNEFIARQFIFRMKEFEQMEMQFFTHPKDEMYWFNYWKNKRLKWHLSLTQDKSKFKFKDHEHLSHYCSTATDIEYNFPFGFKELEGIHSRRDFDLKNHDILSKKNHKYFDVINNKYYYPYVIETSVGLDRVFLSVLSSSLSYETFSKNHNNSSVNSKRLILKISPFLSPIKVAIFPLLQKEELINISIKIYHKLRINFQSVHEYKGSIGKRYRRQDAIGTPLCITVDYDTLVNNSVTLRYRDDMTQKRVNIADLDSIINNYINISNLLKII